MSNRTYAEIYLKEKRIDLRSHRIRDDSPFIQPHKYRVPRRIDMGPVVAAAIAALGARRAV